MELVVDHVMFPVYLGEQLLDEVEATWRDRGYRKVFRRPERPEFLPIYCQSRRFYIEYLANRPTFSYWSNSLFVVVPKEFWSAFKQPAHLSEHFLIPYFGAGYQLVSPEFPHLNSKIATDAPDEGFTVLVSAELKRVLSNLAGRTWIMPSYLKVHSDLKHLHDIAVIDRQNRLVAPLYEANPAQREYF